MSEGQPVESDSMHQAVWDVREVCEREKSACSRGGRPRPCTNTYRIYYVRRVSHSYVHIVSKGLPVEGDGLHQIMGNICEFLEQGDALVAEAGGHAPARRLHGLHGRQGDLAAPRVGGQGRVGAVCAETNQTRYWGFYNFFMEKTGFYLLLTFFPKQH